MKKFILPFCICLAVFQANATQYTISTKGLAFEPGTLTVRVGDTILFDPGPGFTATEVSATTWKLNGNRSLVSENAPGAFDFEEKAILIPQQEGNRYFVCKWHHTTGMKGYIKVLGPGDQTPAVENLHMNIYPIPTQNNLYLNILGDSDIPAILEIMDINGRKVMDLGAKQVLSNGVKPIDVSMLAPGIYYLVVTVNSNIRSLRFVKQ